MTDDDDVHGKEVYSILVAELDKSITPVMNEKNVCPHCFAYALLLAAADNYYALLLEMNDPLPKVALAKAMATALQDARAEPDNLTKH